MRLLKRLSSNGFELVSFEDDDLPPYGILSHTWIEGQEVTLGDLVAGTGSNKIGYDKLRFCHERSAADGLQYFWVDTCSIDKSTSDEISTAINSMFRWYQRASKCYVYLSDVVVPQEITDAEAFRITWIEAFRRSRWFRRGWTLQELLAPPVVEFFSKEGKRLGNKISLEREIYEITKIPVTVLRGQRLAEISIEERMSWVAKRATTLKEDKIYCLLGIFGVFLPLIYGEGEEHAMGRLHEQIQKQRKESQMDCPPNLCATDILFMVPFSRDNQFVGREDIIAEIDKHRVASEAHTRVALVGLGGVGKSQIAIEYAYRIQEKDPYTRVIWIHASNPIRFQQGYKDFADKMSLSEPGNAKADTLQVVHAWLSDRKNGRWLMVLDNVDDDGVFFTHGQESSADSTQTTNTTDYKRPLESFLPQTSNGTILITSRNRAAAINLVERYSSIVEVKPLKEADALALLQTRVPFDESDQVDARALIQTLDGIPLAITQAAAYIDMRAPLMTISTYLDLFHQSTANQIHLLSKNERKDIRRDYSTRDPVIITWQISFSQIRKAEPLAADLLALMSMFDNHGIPIRLLQADGGQLGFNDALVPLLSFSLVRTEIGDQALEMHRLVQLSMRQWLEANNELGEWVKKSIRILSKAFPSGDYGTWTECEALLPHIRKSIGYTTTDKITMLNQADSASRTVWYLLTRGEYKAAEPFGRVALKNRERLLGIEHLDTLRSVSYLGLVLESQGKYKEAEVMHRRALETREKILGLEHPETLRSVNNLGLVLNSQGKYEEAKVMLRRALETREKMLGLEHPYTLNSVNNLGLVLSNQSKYEEAETMHRRALGGKEKMLGLEHPDTLNSINNLGKVLKNQGKYEEAKVMHRRALETREKVLGLEHPDTLKSVNNLGLVLKSQGKYEEAEVMLRRALKGREKILGLEHPDTLSGVQNLANLFYRQRQYHIALEWFQRAYNGYLNAFGIGHPFTTALLSDFERAKMAVRAE